MLKREHFAVCDEAGRAEVGGLAAGVVGGSSGLWEVLTVSMPFLSPSVSVGKEEAEMKNVS